LAPTHRLPIAPGEANNGFGKDCRRFMGDNNLTPPPGTTHTGGSLAHLFRTLPPAIARWWSRADIRAPASRPAVGWCRESTLDSTSTGWFGYVRSHRNGREAVSRRRGR